MIKFVNVTKEYRNHNIVRALEGITFEVDDGEFIFIVGPSGSGKSTIIKLLIREELPSEGEIYFNNIDLARLKRKGLPILRREIGVVFQDYKLLPHKNVFENIAFVLEIAGKPNKEVKKTTDYIAELVGLQDRIENFPHQLSGGETQRAAIARALANDPQVLIADEPTGNLDPDNAWGIIQLLNKVNNSGTTVVMATHDKDVVNSLTKRVIELDKGRIIRDEHAAEYQGRNNDKTKPKKSKQAKK